MTRVVLAPVLCLFLACQALPRTEEEHLRLRFMTLRMETIDASTFDRPTVSGALRELRVLDAHVIDRGAEQVRPEIVAATLPEVAQKLDEDRDTALVRLFVWPGVDAPIAWTATMPPRQLRAIARMEMPQRTQTLARLKWGYIERHKI